MVILYCRCNLFNLYCILTFLVASFIRPISSISCFECESTFPASSICLPSCSPSYQLNSTCLLIRNIPLDASDSGSLQAGHISGEPIISTATEKNFVFGEEAVYLNPSEAVGWNWEYGPITYGCDTDHCNDPRNINRLTNALNARIPNETLNRLLVGEIDSSCYLCDTCLNESVSDFDMSRCEMTSCPSYSCNFVATRNSPTSTEQCGNEWHFSSGCILSRESAQVDMTLMYYLRSRTIVLYQMSAICLSDNCNNFTTFTQLKDAITVDPDLSCLTNETSSSTTSTSTISSPGTPTVSTSTIPSPEITTTTAAGSFADRILLNKKFFLLIVFFSMHK